jgi:hypothetical protein
MNKYLVKVAALLSDENKQVGKTFAIQTAAGIPAHLLGGVVGGAAGSKYLSGIAKGINSSVGRTAARAYKMGPLGKTIGRKLAKAKGVTGATLGVGLGMSAIGGLADLAALKHGFHGKVKNENN